MGAKPPVKPEILRDYAKYSGLGIQMAVSLGLPIYGGWWLDERYASSPWGILIGIALGLLSIFSLLYKLSIQSGNKR